jgi:hypothetical protein
MAEGIAWPRFVHRVSLVVILSFVPSLSLRPELGESLIHQK